MRRLALLVATSVTLALATVVAPAGAADVALSMTSFADMLVDDAHSHLFLTGGGSNGVVVRTLAGGEVTSIHGQPGATGIALSPDSSRLYVALREGDAISAIDTATLAEVARYPTGASTCPAWVSAVGTRVWFGYGCGSSGNVGAVDLGGEAPAVTLATLPAGSSELTLRAPLVEATPDGAYLVAAVKGGSTVYSLTVTDGALGWNASRKAGENLQHVALSGDGAHVVVACGWPYQHPRYAVADLSGSGVYGSGHSYPTAAATLPGFVAAGTDAYYDPDVRVYREDGQLVRTYEIGYGRWLFEGALAFAADGTLFAASEGSSSYSPGVRLHVLKGATTYPTSITLTKPASPKVRTTYTVTGTLTRAGAGATVHVKRTSKFGTKVMPDVVTGTNGTFSFTDYVDRRGPFTYVATYDGGNGNAGTSGSVTFGVTGLVPPLTITTNATTYAHNAVATVTARLGPTLNGRTVALAALPYLASTQYLKNGPVDSGGYIRAQVHVTRRTTFRATFPGDDLYEPRVVTVGRTVHAWVGQTLSGYYATSGSYRLYRRSVDPSAQTTVRPGHVGTCMVFEAQRYVSGAWRAVASNSCIRLENNGVAYAVLTGTPTVGVPYRVRTTFTGSHSNLRTAGAWQHLKFT